MITADQIVVHLVGDYILQSDWMASEKTKRSFAAAVHALTYGLAFVLFRPSLVAFAFIVVTHFVIDRWRLARYVCWAKNFLAPIRYLDWSDAPHEIRSDNPPFAECAATGYSPERPLWLTAWLMIIADNTMHLVLNGIALKYL